MPKMGWLQTFKSPGSSPGLGLGKIMSPAQSPPENGLGPGFFGLAWPGLGLQARARTSLHRIKKVDSDKCTACNESRPEAINHFMFNCVVRIKARKELVKEIGQNHFQFPDILSNV